MSRYFEIIEGSLEDSIVKNIQEKSVSVAQQKAAGIALAAKRGEIDPSKLEGPAKEMMNMSEKDLEDFAKTKHKGLPMKKEENMIDEKVRHQDLVDKYEKLTGKKAPSGTSSQSLKLMIRKAEQSKKESVEEAYSTSSNPKTTDTSTNVAAYRKVFDAAMKKFNISSPSELKTDELRKKFFNYVDANYKAKNEMVSEAVKKIACVECDEVSTEAAWKKNKGFCPKCKSSNKGVVAESKNKSIQEGDMKSAMKKIMGMDVKTSTTGASGFQKTMYHVSDDMYVTYNDKSNLGDVYYKGKNVDSFRGVGTPDMEKVVKKYMKKYGVKTEESGQKTMTGKPWSQIRVENK
jgi:Zn finger protein HypA/HybF involved in hydrogenase expression